MGQLLRIWTGNGHFSFASEAFCRGCPKNLHWPSSVLHDLRLHRWTRCHLDSSSHRFCGTLLKSMLEVCIWTKRIVEECRSPLLRDGHGFNVTGVKLQCDVLIGIVTVAMVAPFSTCVSN